MVTTDTDTVGAIEREKCNAAFLAFGWIKLGTMKHLTMYRTVSGCGKQTLGVLRTDGTWCLTDSFPVGVKNLDDVAMALGDTTNGFGASDLIDELKGIAE